MYSDAQICQLYLNKISVKDLEKLSGFSDSKIYYILKRNNIEFHADWSANRNLSQEKINALIKLYTDGVSCRQIQQKLNIGRWVILKHLTAHGIVIRSNVKYHYDESLFSDLNEKNTHLLGLLFADGCINKRTSYILKIGLSEVDQEYLLYIKDFLFKTDSVLQYKKPKRKKFSNGKEYNCRGSYNLDICNRSIVNDCMSLGLQPRKSWSNTGLPNFLKTEQQYMKHFILGYFEGDGNISIYIGKRKKNGDITKGSWSMMGQEKFVFETKDFLENELNEHFCVSKIKRKTENGSHLYNIQTNKVSTLIKLYHWLYKDASFVMQRKYDKWYELMVVFKERGENVGEIYNFQNGIRK